MHKSLCSCVRGLLRAQALNESAAIAQRELETMSKASFRESAIISDVLTESGLDQCQGKEWTADPAAKEAAQKVRATLLLLCRLDS